MKNLTSAIKLVLVLAGLAALKAPVQADIVQSGREEFSAYIGDPANDEVILIEGEQTFTIRETNLGNGTFWRVIRISTHGAGIGLWSGNPYQFNETYTYSWFDPAGLEYRADLRDFTRLISAGSLPNVLITQTMSVIRDANGVYSFEFNYDYDVTGGD